MSSVVVQTAFLGDVVLTTPLLAALARRDGPLDVVTTPAAAALLETHPAVRRVIPYDKRGADRGWAGLRALARRLAAERYDTAYLPHRSLRSALLARVAGVPRRVGYRDAWRLFYTDARPRPRAMHEVDRLLALADAPDAPRRPSLGLTGDDRAAADGVLAEAAGAGPLAALAPGSIWGSKRWPHFPALAARLATAGFRVATLGGAADAPLGRSVVTAARAAGGVAVDACGRLSLRASAALIARARVLVTNDSAPLHFAQAVGTPTVALFGPTVPEFGFGPVNPGDVALGVDGLACRPCSAHGPPACPLGHHRCMTMLEVARVADAAERLARAAG